MSVPRKILTWAHALAVMVISIPSAAFAHGAFDERIARISADLQNDPNNTALRIQLADVRCQHGDWALALIELDRIDVLAPGKFATDLMRGEAFLTGKLPSDAKQALDRFIAAHPAPPHAKAFTFRARAHDALGSSEACLADYRAAWLATMRPEPDFVQEFANALAARGQLDESLQILTTGIEKIGAVPALVILAMEREIATGRFDAALARIDAMQQTAPRPEPWMSRRAALLSRAGRTAESRAAWQALIDRLAALPNLERGSHAMSVLAEQARAALTALQSLSDLPTPPVSVSKS